MLPESKQQHGDQHNGPVALSIEHRRASSQAFKAEDSRPLLSKGSLQGEPNCSSTSEHEHVAGRAEVGPTAEHSQLHTRAGAFLKASKALLG